MRRSRNIFLWSSPSETRINIGTATLKERCVEKLALKSVRKKILIKSEEMYHSLSLYSLMRIWSNGWSLSLWSLNVRRMF